MQTSGRNGVQTSGRYIGCRSQHQICDRHDTAGRQGLTQHGTGVPDFPKSKPDLELGIPQCAPSQRQHLHLGKTHGARSTVTCFIYARRHVAEKIFMCPVAWLTVLGHKDILAQGTQPLGGSCGGTSTPGCSLLESKIELVNLGFSPFG